MKINWCENKAIELFGWLCFFPLLFITQALTAQTSKSIKEKQYLTKPLTVADAKDSSNNAKKVIIKTGTDTSLLKDSSIIVTDTLHIPTSKDSLDAPIAYEAADSGVLNIADSRFLLYGKASTKYQTINLTASIIEMDNGKNIAKAYFTKDTSGKVIERPKLIDGDMETESDSMFINMKTKKGLTKSTYTKQGEIFMHGDVIKKFSETEYYALRARFTTCNLDTPHFAFRAKRVKLVNKKWAYSGLVFPEFEGVPLPVGLPFGIFPLSQGRHSGLLAPQYTATQNYGIGLQGLGYYKVINEHLDATLRTDIYSYGGYNLYLSSAYIIRYKFQGRINLTYLNTKLNFKGDPDYSNNKTYSVQWDHAMDSKKRPGTSFSSNVNFSSIKFNQNVLYNSQLNIQNTAYSTIQYSKTSDDGKTNLSITASHSQNNNIGQYDISLPTVTYTVSTIYPFQKKEAIGGSKWWEKLGIGYSGSALNRFSFFESDSVKYNAKQIIDTMQWGAQHSLPISLSLPPLGVLQVSPGVSYRENWYGLRTIQAWDGRKVVSTKQNGFYTAREMSFNLNFATAIFGTFNFKDSTKKIQAIRHVIRPNFGLSYKPDFAKSSYYNTRLDSTGDMYRLSYYTNNIIGSISSGQFGGLTFGLQNNLEMKVRNKKDTTGEASTKKIRLLDNFSITSSYNLISDSFALTPFSILASTTLFEKVSVTASSYLDPYQVNAAGRRINKYAWQAGKFSPGRLTNGTLSLSTSFTSKQKKTEKKADEDDENISTITPEEQQRELEYIRNNPSEFADFNVPWTLSLTYSLLFSNRFNTETARFKYEVNSNLSLSGDFNFSPKWKMGGSTYFDLKTLKMGYLSLFISREMHCWQMAINVTPVGPIRSFNISISPKSGLLRDLKINRNRVFPR